MKVPAPFLWAAVIWAILSLLIIGVSPAEPKPSLIRWFLVVWFVCLLDFLALAGFCRTVLQSRVDTFQALIWGSGKMLGLGLVGFTLWYAKSVSALPLLLGVSTIVVIPLGGAIGLSRRK